MIEFGKTLRAAREACGLSIADIASRTRMMSTTVEDLENENFSRLPAPIYGRGFIKLYCGVVGLDPVPFIAEFMEICNGNREQVIRERAVAPSAEPEPLPQKPQAVAETVEAAPSVSPDPVLAAEPPHNEQLDLFSAPAESAEPVPTARQVRQVLPEPTPEPEEPEAPRGPVFSRYASPLRERAAALPRVAPAVGRWSAVVAVLTLVVWGIAVGVKALYRATSADEKSAAGTVSAQSSPAAQKSRSAVRPVSSARPISTAKTDRTPLPIPPLYID